MQDGPTNRYHCFPGEWRPARPSVGWRLDPSQAASRVPHGIMMVVVR